MFATQSDVAKILLLLLLLLLFLLLFFLLLLLLLWWRLERKVGVQPQLVCPNVSSLYVETLAQPVQEPSVRWESDDLRTHVGGSCPRKVVT